MGSEQSCRELLQARGTQSIDEGDGTDDDEIIAGVAGEAGEGGGWEAGDGGREMNNRDKLAKMQNY